MMAKKRRMENNYQAVPEDVDTLSSQDRLCSLPVRLGQAFKDLRPYIIVSHFFNHTHDELKLTLLKPRLIFSLCLINNPRTHW